MNRTLEVKVFRIIVFQFGIVQCDILMVVVDTVTGNIQDVLVL